MLYVLIAHKNAHYNRRYDEHTEGVFVCEELDSPEAVEARMVQLLEERDYDTDDLFVYEIAGRDGDAYFNAEGDSPNTALKFMNAVRAKVEAAKAASSERAARVRAEQAEALRKAQEQNERNELARLRAKYEAAL